MSVGIAEPPKAGSAAYYPAHMDMEIRKLLWTAFAAKKTLVDIIKEHGYVPEIVEREYRTFLRSQGINLTEM